MKLVSVIVPVYKVENYLEQSVGCIRQQTYSNLEIILVDDGSPDGSGALCDKLAAQDPRIKVVHKENGGPGMARNSGLEVATGDYVLFLDSDDQAEPDMAKVLVEAAERNGAQLAVCGFRKCKNNMELIAERRKVDKETVFRGRDEIMASILAPICGPDVAKERWWAREFCLWTNLYSLSVIREHAIRFPSERECLTEDFFFNVAYMMHVDSAVMVPDCLYSYRFNDASFSNSYRPDKIALLQKRTRMAIDWMEKHGIKQVVGHRLERDYFKRVRFALIQALNAPLSGKEKKEIFRGAVSHPLTREVLEDYPTGDLPMKEKIMMRLFKKGHAGALKSYLSLQNKLIRLRGWRN